MEKDCDPQLRLQLGSSEEYSSSANGKIDDSDPTKSNRVVEWFSNTAEQQQQQQEKKKKITIFYNGRMCVCDVTEIQRFKYGIRRARWVAQFVAPPERQTRGHGFESHLRYFQARAIIWMASREMEERAEKSKNQQHDQNRMSSPRTNSIVTSHLINPDISMKRSLKRFLEKRKMRMDASMPYSFAPEWPTPPSSSR